MMKISLKFIIFLELLVLLRKAEVTLATQSKKGVGRATPAPEELQYYGGFKHQRQCKPTSQAQFHSFSHSPRISVRYDGRQFNGTFTTLKKLSVRENVLEIRCTAKYPITLIPNPLMVDKALLKSFEDNMDTYCHSENVPKSPCLNYTTSTSIPVHLLYLSIDTQCQSYCRQVLHISQLKLADSKGTIYGNITNIQVPKTTEKPRSSTTPGFVAPHDDDSTDLVKIFVSPVGSSGKNWIVKCSTNSGYTAKGATMTSSEPIEEGPMQFKETKEYRKSGIHTIRATFDLNTESVDNVHCSFPKLNDFPWISTHTSIHFHNPISYWECILRLCGAFACSFIVISGVCILIHKFIHSDCCTKKNVSSTVSQASLNLNVQKSLQQQSSFGSGSGEAYGWGVYNSQLSLEGGSGGLGANRRVVMERLAEEKLARERGESLEEKGGEEKAAPVAQLHGSISSCHL